MPKDSKAHSKMTQKLCNLRVEDFADIVGTSTKDIFPECVEVIKNFNFHYRNLDSVESEEVIKQITQRINSGNLDTAGKHKREKWEKGWSENLNEFIASSQNIQSLIPKYMGSPKPLRLLGKYIMPEDAMFEVHWFEVFRNWIFRKYLSDKDAVYEFGCGTGHNLAALAVMFPQKKLYGLDWVLSSVKIIDLLSSKYDYSVKGCLFDFFNPDKNIDFSENSAMLTIHALEQIGSSYQKFLEFILEKRPTLCINIEPIIEFYDKNNSFDSLAIAYHKKRGYLNGYFTELENLQCANKIEIINAKRVSFGSLYHEAYSYVIWRPMQ